MDRALALTALGTAAVVAVHLVPGALGILTRGTALAAALLLLGGVGLTMARSRRRAGAEPAPPRAPRSGPASWVLAGGAAGAVGLWLVANAWNHTAIPPEGIDTLTFHLPVVAKWIQNGTFWRVDQFTPFLANGNYPQNGDVVFLSLLLPFRSDAFIALVNPLYVALAGASVFALSRELGAPRATGTLAAAAFASLPVVAFGTNGQAMTDSIAFALLGAGALFLVRHERTARRSDLAVAGLALGLAFGTKWYGVWAAGLIVAAWVAARAVGRRPWRRTLAGVGTLAGLVLVAGGFWLVRNWVESGNPLFPAQVKVLGATVFAAPRDLIRECADFTIAHYLTDGHAWSAFIWPAYRGNYAPVGAVLALGALGAAAVALRGWARARPRGGVAGPRPQRLALAGFACALALAAAYAVTPNTAPGPEGRPLLTGANARYLVPALLIAAPLAAWAAGRARRLRPALELVAAVAVVDGIRRGFTVPFNVVAGVAAVLLALVVVGRLLRARATPALVWGTAALGLVALGYGRQREYDHNRYKSGEAVTAWVARHAPAGHRIALAGSWGVNGRSPVWPAFGPRLRNRVDYLGPTVRHQLREYSTRRSWAAAIRRGRYDLLIVGRGGYARRTCPLPGQFSDDDRWARAERFRPIVRTERLTLYAVAPGLARRGGA